MALPDEEGDRWLIATDEAGYGPKLGPLVVVATAWRLPPSEQSSLDQFQELFSPLREPVTCDGLSFRVDDSKAVFQPPGELGRRKLHAAISSSLRWCNISAESVGELLPSIAAQDLDDLGREHWWDHLGDEPFLASSITEPVVARWRTAGAIPLGAVARVITPRQFNGWCRAGKNKADLLTEATLGLIRTLFNRNDALLNQPGDGSPVEVFCDRHGGRRYYGGILQHFFPDAPVVVDYERPDESRYRFGFAAAPGRIRFTVRGDSFPPVAMSSLYAKFLRECCMAALNRFFAAHHSGKQPLRPTAGYPGDAKRFIAEVQSICQRLRIAEADWVRCR